MSANLRIVNKCITQYPSSLFMRCAFTLQKRDYAKPTSFPDYYQNPIFRKDEQAILMNEGELSRRASLPVKPPAAHESSSAYHDPLVNKLINQFMREGNKKLARNLVEKAFENIKRKQIERYHLALTPEDKAKIELNPKDILHKAIENSKPLLQLTPFKRGGITYQVPGPITEKRSLFLAIKWLLEATSEKEKRVHFPEQFAWEVLEAANNTGKVIKRKQDLHRQCEANRAYAHYRWQ